MPTQSEIKAALAKLQAVADAIKAAKRIPSGNLYAAAMNVLSLQEYEKIIGILCKCGKRKGSRSLLVVWDCAARGYRSFDPARVAWVKCWGVTINF